uniref:Basic tail secreted protein n=1 Tax=Rhipicephalus appendiculatus TaxID=34631 RepID=A0A131YRC6_RHIAP
MFSCAVFIVVAIEVTRTSFGIHPLNNAASNAPIVPNPPPKHLCYYLNFHPSYGAWYVRYHDGTPCWYTWLPWATGVCKNGQCTLLKGAL